MRPALIAAALALFAAAAGSAAADPGAEEPTADVAAAIEAPSRRWNAALSLHGVLGGGLVGEGERLLAPRWSAAALVGLRSTSTGDFRSVNASAGLEVRYWLLGWTVRSPLRESIVGGYLAGGLELSGLWMRDAIDDRSIGSTTSVALTGSVGYRFAPWSRVSITPSAGLAVGRDMASRGIPDRYTIRPRWSLTAGVLF